MCATQLPFNYKTQSTIEWSLAILAANTCPFTDGNLSAEANPCQLGFEVSFNQIAIISVRHIDTFLG